MPGRAGLPASGLALLMLHAPWRALRRSRPAAWRSCRLLCSACTQQDGKIEIEQVADALDRQVGRRIGREDAGIERVMPLAREDGREPLPQDLLHRRQDAELVVDHDVMAGRVALLDVVEHLLLVDVDEDPALDRVPQSRSLDLARLEDHVAVGQDDRGPPLAKMPEHVECPRIEPVRKRIVHEERGHLQQARIVRVIETVALQGAEVIRVTQLGSQLLEDLPIAIPALGPELAREVRAQIVLHPIVVEQRVVAVEQEDDFCGIHAAASSHRRKPPRIALALSPRRVCGGSRFRCAMLPPPRTMTSGSSAMRNPSTTSCTLRRHFRFPSCFLARSPTWSSYVCPSPQCRWPSSMAAITPSTMSADPSPVPSPRKS